METIITSFGHKGYKLYGLQFLKTFAEFWPSKTPLICYREAGETHPRATMRDLFAVEAFKRFAAAHEHDEAANGRTPAPCWKGKDIDLGYSFRTDAMKFCRKVFAVQDAAHCLGTGTMAWIDADVCTLRPVPHSFIEQMLDGHAFAYLGRGRIHSECGFLAFRLPDALPLIERWAGFYETGEVFSLPETHDSFVFDRAREALPDIHGRDLTPGGVQHCWVRSPLAPFMDHKKGDRKELGYSPEMRRS